MIYYDLPAIIQTKIKTLDAYQNRVFIVTDFAALVLMQKTATPLIGIIPNEAPAVYLKGRINKMEYSFDIWVVQNIRHNGEAEVLTGGINKKGLLELTADLFDLLKNELFTTETSGVIADASILSLFAPKGYQLGDGNISLYNAAMGLKIRYLEFTT